MLEIIVCHFTLFFFSPITEIIAQRIGVRSGINRFATARTRPNQSVIH